MRQPTHVLHIVQKVKMLPIELYGQNLLKQYIYPAEQTEAILFFDDYNDDLLSLPQFCKPYLFLSISYYLQ